MNNFLLKNLPTGIFGAILLSLEVISAAPSQALTLTGFTTCGGDMPGVRVTVGFLDGTSQTATWGVTDSSYCYRDYGGSRQGKYGGGAFGDGWSLTESDNTFYAPWTFSSDRSIYSLLIDAVAGNTVFDIYPDLDGPRQTPGSADGKEFTVTSGTAPNFYSYYVPIQDAKSDLYGSLLLKWDSGFTGKLQFVADTDSAESSDPAKGKQPPPPLPLPAPPKNNTPPTLSFSDYTINEGQSASVTLSATDPDPDPITFKLGGQTITDSNTSGTRSATFNLGTYADNGSVLLTGTADDGKGGTSSLNRTLTVLNVAPTLTSFALNGNNSDITIDEGTPVSAVLSATDPGLYDDVTFFVNGSNKGTDTTDTTGTRSITTNLGTFNDDAVLTYTAIARDKDNADSNAITRTVTVRNVPPTLTAFNLLNDTIDQGQSAIANLSATDPGADPTTFLINGTSVGTDPTLSGTRSLSTNLGLFSKPGTYTFTAQAQDDDGGFSNIIEKTLTVKNVAPTITSLTAPLIVPSGSLFDFSATATDPGGDLLTYGWDFSNNGLFNDFTGQSGKWSFGRDGLYDVALRVSDGYGGFAYRSFQIESVPEPTSALGVLAFGALGIGSVLKRKQQQKA